jgi:hypothetical protein
MLEKLQKAFRAQPRVVEAYLVGERLIPEDGSAPWEASSIVLVLDPPLDNASSDTLRHGIEALVAAFKETGWERDPVRSWTFSTRAESRRHRQRGARLIYEKSRTND